MFTENCIYLQTGPEKKYFKRGDLVAIEKEEYMAKYGHRYVDSKSDQSSKAVDDNVGA